MACRPYIVNLLSLLALFCALQLCEEVLQCLLGNQHADQTQWVLSCSTRPHQDLSEEQLA